MSKNETYIKTISLEKRLLSTFFSGIFITNSDIVKIGKHFNIVLAHKKKELILKELFTEAKKNSIFKEVSMMIIDIINDRIEQYKQLIDKYPKSQQIINKWIQKANSLKLLLQREMAGNIYE